MGNDGIYEFLNDYNSVLQANTDGYVSETAQRRMEQYYFREDFNTDFRKFYRKIAHKKETMIKG